MEKGDFTLDIERIKDKLSELQSTTPDCFAKSGASQRCSGNIITEI
ncbi:MAG: hypothetical protein KAQ92_01060 [Candidatus Aenigmarchaeota archaeon]|nr:hypothetical protein [Candidatus Aenigmarchaeota archaeon]